MLEVDVSSDGRLSASDQRSGKAVTQSVPKADLAELERLLSGIAVQVPGSRNPHCADCFVYDLTYRSGGQVFRMEEDDTTIDASLAKDVIALLRKLRHHALGEDW